ncbi:DUF3566 domain-containing protein [Gordonia crocea]|uniref:DUF3566 domain-containing protein n=1 Tax=Gordonia crocea TaxID=589162 RepID=A0A7M3SU83_9ACTN|nr:DUF3566 domain-containing protein [Gordonia crocea]GED96207.1 hypothetical protein nbrc107697_02460 [Gordonia crocea]
MTTSGPDPKDDGEKSKAETTEQATASEAAQKAADLAKTAEQGSATDDAGGNGAGSGTSAAAGDSGPADKPGVKPPWQRADELAPETSGAVPPPPGPSSKKKKPIITGTAAPKIDEPKIDEPGASSTDSPEAQDGFVESPTRSIGRSQLKAKDLPNLDEIHAAPVGAAGRGVPQGQRSAPTHVGSAGGSRALRATVQIRRIDPWSTLKISAILSVIGFFIWMIAVAILYLILDGMGIWSQVNSSVGTLTTDGGGASDAIGAGTVFGWAFLLGIVDAILLTALATVGAFVYNLCADFIGGVEVTLADLD